MKKTLKKLMVFSMTGAMMLAPMSAMAAETVETASPAEGTQNGTGSLEGYVDKNVFAGLEKDVVLAGMLNRIEIWSKTKWMENNSCDNMDDIAEQMSDLGLCI